MKQKKRERLYMFGGAFIAAAGAVALTLTALSQSITYFYTPSELADLEEAPTRPIRLGGLVLDGSVKHPTGPTSGEQITFVVTDGGAEVRVSYKGLLPDLFREGQGVVVQGKLIGANDLVADNVLAKHDENYMPKEVADALKEQGRWKDGDAGS
ncbi:MAG: cytochrome c maturation protein CcmE [Pseudomonadota bacterium]